MQAYALSFPSTQICSAGSQPVTKPSSANDECFPYSCLSGSSTTTCQIDSNCHPEGMCIKSQCVNPVCTADTESKGLGFACDFANSKCHNTCWIARVGNFEMRKARHALTVGLGFLMMSLMLARAFGKFYGGFVSGCSQCGSSCSNRLFLCARNM